MAIPSGLHGRAHTVLHFLAEMCCNFQSLGCLCAIGLVRRIRVGCIHLNLELQAED